MRQVGRRPAKAPPWQALEALRPHEAGHPIVVDEHALLAKRRCHPRAPIGTSAGSIETADVHAYARLRLDLDRLGPPPRSQAARDTQMTRQIIRTAWLAFSESMNRYIVTGSPSRRGPRLFRDFMFLTKHRVLSAQVHQLVGHRRHCRRRRRPGQCRLVGFDPLPHPRTAHASARRYPRHSHATLANQPHRLGLELGRGSLSRSRNRTLLGCLHTKWSSILAY